ncbi:MAG TPA: IS200/IS605 family transposase [Caulifigura sp.]|nr:IS200/IS605 family transposase [Caulifigura sp.]
MAGSFTCLNDHIVFSTKERRPVLTSDLREPLFPYVAGILKNLKCHLIQSGGVNDHVHFLVQMHQSVSLADCVRTIKSDASKWLGESHDDKWVGWQDGYGAFSVSKSGLPAVEEYVVNQEKHHARICFQDEFRTLLRRHGIEYDEKYIWD